MLKPFLGACAAAALLASAAHAADLPVKSPPPFIKPLPIFTWTGFYVGANAGYSFGQRGNARTVGTPAFAALGPTIVPGSLDTKSSGFIGGGQVGYNYQYQNFVLGLEADFDYVDQKKTSRFTGTGTVLGSTLTTSASSQLDFLGTLRARIGYTPTERLLLFATGGLAVGDVQNTGSVVANAAPILAWSGSNSKLQAGYAVGGGAEYAYTDAISFKVEYLYYDLGRQTVSALGNANVRATPALNGVDYIARTSTAGSVIRAGVNYKF